MIERPQQNQLRAAGKGIPSSGGFVFVRVLEKTGDGAYLVEFKGKRVEVLSKRPLHAGEERSGRFIVRKGRMEFLPIPEKGRIPAKEAAPVPQTVSAASPEVVKGLLVQAFMRAGASLPGKERLKELSELVGKEGHGSARKRAALAARIEEKGLFAEKEAFEGLMEFLEGDFSGGERRGRNHGGKKRENEDLSLKEVLQKQDEGSSSLQVFNHVASETGSWTILPYGFLADDLEYEGSIRLWYNGRTKRWEKAVLSVREITAGKTWYFRWFLAEGEPRIAVFTDDERWAVEKERSEFKRKLRKLGLKSDDNCYKEEDFDGFETGKDVSRLVDATV